MRMDKETHNTAASTPSWNKAECTSRVQQITRQLQDIRVAVGEVLNLHRSDSVASPCKHHTTTPDSCRRTSGLVQSKVYGRSAEKDSIINLMKADKSYSVTVLPIVGIGGVGKTALAQFAYNYNDPGVKNLFDNRIWVSVSKDFNGVRLVREMLDLSVAKKIGTVEPIKLAASENKDFWLLFKACAFGDDNYEGHPSLNIIGQQIVEKLQGNPLAAETAGVLLRENLTIDHWSNIMKNEDWKSLQLSGGIMPSLKLSFDELPLHLQQCFSYCSIFPKNYRFKSEELIRIWIAQGFVNGDHSSKRLEEIGWGYLIDLVNSGFFQQVERKMTLPGNQTCYVMCGLMHDFAMMVSRTDCATIDGLQCNEILPTVHHLSIVSDSAYRKDQHGNILRNEKFEEKLLDVVASVRKLRTLVLIGQYDPFFLQSFQNLFKEAQNLRVLQISRNCAGFISFLCNVVNPTYLRYLKLEAGVENGALPEVLSNFFHLQVLDVGSNSDLAISNGANNMVSLRHHVAEKGVYSSNASIGKLTSLQELHNFRVQNSSGFEITHLQSLNELVQLGVSQLDNVTNREEAYGAGLTNKQHLEKLRLFWNHSLPQELDSEREVLEGLKPHPNLKHLQISGYNGATSPTWLASSLTSLQTLHLEYCGELQILPSLELLPFLRKIELRNILNLTELSIPLLEELVLDEIPKLERCSCTSVNELNSSLRVLRITECPLLKVFPLFENCQKFKIEQKSWLSRLSELTIHDCPHLMVSNPLPPSTSTCELSIGRVSTLLTMVGSSSGELTIYYDEPRMLDDKILSFHSLRFLNHLTITGCQNISFEGFWQLISLKSLEIFCCKELFYSHVPPDDTQALPYLERLCIVSCGIAWKWLSLMLRHMQALEELSLDNCLPMVEEASSSAYPLNVVSLKKISIEECPGLTFYGSKEGFAEFTSLVKLNISGCPELLSSSVHKNENDDQTNGRWLLPQSLGELEIHGDYPLETLQPCFPENLTCLRKLDVWDSKSQKLKSLQLHSCTALEELTIRECGSLASLEGFQSLGGLRHLQVSGCPGLPSCFENFSSQCSELCPRLETLMIDGPSVLTSSFCKHLTSLQRLKLFDQEIEVARLTDEQERVLQLLASLQELQFLDCWYLVDLPAGLHRLPSLRRLLINNCRAISRLTEKGLPPSLEELEVSYCSKELTEQCRMLATSKLKFKNYEEFYEESVN